MELDTEWSLSISETFYNFACFGVPELYYSIKTSTQELSSIIAETNVPNCFCVPHIGSHTSSMIKYIPNLDGTIMTS
jgi:hypothetical protein